MIRKFIRNTYFKYSTKESSAIIGIDLGTTNSCVAIMENNKPRILQNSQGMRTTPSVIAFANEGEVLVGSAAKRQAILNSQNTIFATKRLIGRRFQQELVQNFSKDLPYKIVRHSNGDAWVQVKEKVYSPAQISALILKKMKDAAQSYVGKTVSKAVITVPAYFNDSQRQATINAGKMAGFNVQRIINQPTAAALAYGIQKKQLDQIIAVYDLGGGTFDISILEINQGVIQVKATNGDTSCGGQDADTILQKYLLQQFRKKTGIDCSKNKIVIQRIRQAAEKAKQQLTQLGETQINLPFLASDAFGPKHFRYVLTRAKFQNLIQDLLKKTLKPCQQCIKDSGISKRQINQVILVGGMTKMPKVQQMVQKFFGKTPKKSINPDEAVAIGAAIQGGILRGDFRDLLLIDITPLSLGIQTLGGVMAKIISKNTTIPTKKSKIFTTAFDNQSKVSIKIFQGEKQLVEQNKYLGSFTLKGIQPAQRGKPQIQVTFDIDSNGIVHVSAKNMQTEIQQKIIIENSAKMSQQQINKIIKKLQQFKEGENQKRYLANLKKQIQYVYQMSKFGLKQLKIKAPIEDFQQTQNILQKLGEWQSRHIKTSDIECLKDMLQQIKLIHDKYFKNQLKKTQQTKLQKREQNIKN